MKNLRTSSTFKQVLPHYLHEEGSCQAFVIDVTGGEEKEDCEERQATWERRTHLSTEEDDGWRG
ncbi:hypothetical protein E2C01_037993 [Portunus trituberculatus]|uniref:Uncharacterized protein n=1 Tax=Portunus trituberculatus TaxID=210409 RepID=A0A5B7F9M0_PORTR|nr:hypothetical protein [Portunus trituberculatus]